MDDKPTEPIRREQRILDGLEVSLRGLNANLQRARPVLERLHHDHAELVADLFGELESFDGEAAVKALVALKAALEGSAVSEEWEPSSGERQMIAAAGLDWARALIRRSRDHLQRSESVRAHPIIAYLVAVHERLAGIERLLLIMREEERNQ